MKKYKGLLILALVAILVILVGGLGYMQVQDRQGRQQPANQTQTSRSTSKVIQHEHNQSVPAKQAVQMDPNQTAGGQEVSMDDIKKTQSQLVQAGLPADQWAPSDIKKIIVESSRLKMDVTTYARQNFHGQ